MIKSIRVRLTLYFSIVIFIILFGASYLIYHDAYNNRISYIDGSLRVVIGDLVYDIIEEKEHFGKKEIDNEMLELEKQLKVNTWHTRIVRYDLDKKQQTIIAKTSKTKMPIFQDWDFETDFKEGVITFETSNNYRVAQEFAKINDKSLLLVQSAVKISFKDESLKNTLFILSSVNFVIFLFSILGVYFLIARTLKPVYSVVTSVNEIEAYDYNKRIKNEDIPIELKELVDTFNKLLSRHKESFSKISQFSSDVSHELKTPLTVMRGEVEVGLRKSRSEDEYRSILNDILSESTKIQHLIDGLLFLAQTDKLEIRSTFEEVYIDEVLTECVEELKNHSDEKDIKIEIRSLIPITTKGNSTLLKIACKNLLKNAIDYSTKGKKIKVWTEVDADIYTIIIKDQGIGIKKDDLELIFDRFYRVDKSRTRSSGGTGLGLSIVKMILDIHGFDIYYESQIEKGTLVKISLKK